MDWLLYDRDLHHKSVKSKTLTALYIKKLSDDEFERNSKHSKSECKMDSFYLAWRKRISNMRNSKSDAFGKMPCNGNYQKFDLIK